MKPGTKLRSTVCSTEVLVIRGIDVEVACGGASMAEEKPDESGTLDFAFAESTQMGKRYVNETGTVELLCVKPGKGSLSIDGVILRTKDAKHLPSSD